MGLRRPAQPPSYKCNLYTFPYLKRANITNNEITCLLYELKHIILLMDKHNIIVGICDELI